MRSELQRAERESSWTDAGGSASCTGAEVMRRGSRVPARRSEARRARASRPEPEAGADDRACDRVELGRPAGRRVASRRRGEVVGQGLDDRPLPGGVEPDAVSRRDGTRFAERLLQPRPPRAVVAEGADRASPEATVAAASTASRAAFSHRTARSSPPTTTSSPGTRNGASAASSASCPRLREAAVIIASPAVRWTTTPGSGEYASTRPMLPAGHRGRACARAKRARIASTCSRPFSSGRTTAPRAPPVRSGRARRRARTP